jgi:hypothetical protein
MSIIETPFTKSPPVVQLMTLVAFNSAIFVGSALIQRAFHVDILPIVCSMTGANPIDAPRAPPAPSRTTGAAAAAPTPAGAASAPAGTANAAAPPPPAQNAFAAFAKNF